MKVVKTGEEAPPVITNPLLGSDPEVFVFSLSENRIHPVLDLLGGTKEAPRPLSTPGFFVQEDNVLAEFNIPPAKNKKEFVGFIRTGQDLLRAELAVKGFVPVITPSHSFQLEQLTDARAMLFGCTPDYNAWLGLEIENPTPSPENFPLLRSAGGHVILGYDNPTRETNVAFVKLCDALLGVPSVILDNDSDRRKLYGKAGAFRHKGYGVEYRTLSSFWLKNEDYTAWVWDQAMRAVDLINTGNYALLDYEPFIVDTINNANVKNAKQFVSEFEIKMP